MKKSQSKLYSLKKHVKRAGKAVDTFWTRTWVSILFMIILTAIDGITLFLLFRELLHGEVLLIWTLTFGFSITLNFIPLVIARLYHFHRYGIQGVRKWMIITMILIFFLLFLFTFIFRLESLKKDDSIALTILLGIMPLATSTVNLALSYLTDDPVKKKLQKLQIQTADTTAQLHIMYAAAYELSQDWEQSYTTLEESRLAAAQKEVKQGSEYIRSLAQLSLAKKLGDPDSISQLTDQ